MLQPADASERNKTLDINKSLRLKCMYSLVIRAGRTNIGNKAMTQVKTFLLIDDKHPDFYVGQCARTDEQIKPALRALNVGDILNTSATRAIQRTS